MTSNATTAELPRLWPEPWARQAAVKADAIERQMLVAAAGAAPLSARKEAAVEAIRCLLASSREAMKQKGRLRWRGPLDRWRGTSVEHAYQSLHAAKIFLVELLAPEDVDALAPSVLAKVSACLPPEDIRRLRLERITGSIPVSAPVPALPPGAAPQPGHPESLPDAGLAARQNGYQRQRRADIRQAMEIAYDASNQLHGRVRGFRNILLAGAALITLFMAALVVVVSRYPDAMPLCFHPTVVTAPGATGAAITVCPNGQEPGQQPGSADVVIVAGLGLLGSALAAAFGIRKIRGTSTPYDVPIALALLKVPSGALTAVAGILLLGGGFVPGLSELDSQRQILAYALVLGYAQQLATRFIDDRAQTLLNSVPSKDAEAKQPEAVARPAPQPLPQLQPQEPA